MRNRTFYYIAAGILAATMAFSPVSAKKNIFQRTKTAVRDFFSDDNKDEDKALAVSEADEEATTIKKEETDSRPSESNVDRVDYKTAEDLYDQPFETNLHSPKLGGQKNKIREYQQIVAKKLIAAGHSIETTRNGEVIVATIAAEDLFLPNDTTLRSSAAKYLKPYANFLKEDDFYHMLLSMHSDNTGSDYYTTHLTEARAIAILNWFKANADHSDYVIPFGMGSNDPLHGTPNNSLINREKNRRLEIYLVPGKAMIRKSARGQLK